jgi:hypothetical protein
MAYKTRQSYLQIRGPVYYFRVAVPRRLLPVFDKKEYKKSLKTGEYEQARYICIKYALFVERYFELVKRMQPTRDDINLLIRNHFEKCLIDAEASNWWIYNDFEDETPKDDIETIIGQEKDSYQSLLKLAYPANTACSLLRHAGKKGEAGYIRSQQGI